MKAIFFDFGGTLDSNGIAWKDRFAPIYAQCGIAVEQQRFDRAFYDSDDNLPLRHNLKNLGLEATLKLQIADVFSNLRLGNPAAGRKVLDKFLSDSRKSFSENKRVLALLKKEYKLGVISNFYGNLESVLKSEGLLEYFDAVADSSVVGATKPDAALFDYALSALGAKPEESVMVGDSVRRDMAGAKNSGLFQMLLWGERYASGNPPELGPRGAVLKNLAELPGKLPAAVKV